MSRYLVTGGSGRLGRSIVAHLVGTGHDVTSVDLQQCNDLPAEQLIVDLSDADATQRAFASVQPDAIIHLAAIAVPFSRPDAEIYATNTGIMYSVLDAAISCNVKAMLVASSPTVIGYGNPEGWLPHFLPLDETHPVEPWHGYAASKQALEQIVAMAVRQSGSKIRLGIFRPCFVIAPEEWLGAPTQQGHTVRERLDNPELSAVALFNYLDARDASDFVQAWLVAADHIPNGSCFFVGAADALAREPVSELLPRYLKGSSELASELTGTRPVFDCSQAERLLGWTAKRSWRTELNDQGASEGAD